MMVLVSILLICFREILLKQKQHKNTTNIISFTENRPNNCPHHCHHDDDDHHLDYAEFADHDRAASAAAGGLGG